VQSSKERLELVKILESLKTRRLNRGLWFPPATSFGIRVVGRRVVRPRSVVRLCNDCCIVIKSFIRLSGMLCHNRRSQCHFGIRGFFLGAQSAGAIGAFRFTIPQGLTPWAIIGLGVGDRLEEWWNRELPQASPTF